MDSILEKQAAITNERRAGIVEKFRDGGYQYILPKDINGLFSAYCVGFKVEDGEVDFDKPTKGALCFLVEDKRDLPEIKRRIARAREFSPHIPDFEYWIYSKGKDGVDRGKKVA